ncbi:MAG TPA: glycosyltransferase family 9 protein [bacterium]|nr:glycosyltransferase family 9 protein [bacterium]
MTPSFQKILILRPRFLGDLILATGLPELFHKANPDAKVWFLTEAPYAPLLEGHPRVAGVLALDPSRKNDPFYQIAFYRKLRAEKFDLVLDLFGNMRTAFLSFFSGAPVRVGFENRGRSWAYTHLAPPSSPAFASGRRRVTEAYLDQVRVLGLPVGNYRTLSGVTEAEKAQVERILERASLKPGEKLAVICPGASWPAKRWPLEKFIELGFWLKKSGVRPLYIFGPKEGDLAEEFQDHMDKDWLVIDQPNLRGLMAFIEAADVLVANDSGPMHVGPSVGTPTLGIFGPGEPEIWFPYDAPHRAAYAEVPCSHCGLDHCSLMACMAHLDVKTMARNALEMIALKGSTTPGN